MFTAGNTFSYSFPTNIRFGAGVSEELGPHLKSKGFSRPLIVSDPVVSELAFFQKIIKNLKEDAFNIALFSEVHKNPIKSDVYKGGDAYHAGNCDCIVGIGGGVALDVSRAIALRAYHTKDLFDYDDLLDGWKLVTEEIPYFVTIPTNAGTGSEVGRSTVISEDETHKKRVLFSPRLIASQIFADPLLTMDLPPLVTAATGMDALAHNVEALLAKGFHPMADGIALEAIKLIAANLEKAVFTPDLNSRANMLIASLMGAVAFQKGLGIIHSLAHPLSTLVDAHHGTAISLMFGHGLRYNKPGAEEAFQRLGNAMGLQNNENLVDETIDHISGLNRKFGLPIKLSQIGVKKPDITKLASLAVDDFCLPCNHRSATMSDLETIYSDAF